MLFSILDFPKTDVEAEFVKSDEPGCKECFDDCYIPFKDNTEQLNICYHECCKNV